MLLTIIAHRRSNLVGLALMQARNDADGDLGGLGDIEETVT